LASEPFESKSSIPMREDADTPYLPSLSAGFPYAIRFFPFFYFPPYAPRCAIYGQNPSMRIFLLIGLSRGHFWDLKNHFVPEPSDICVPSMQALASLVLPQTPLPVRPEFGLLPSSPFPPNQLYLLHRFPVHWFRI